MTTKVCFVAAPLTARSGVYRSAREIVEEGRAQGLDWSLFLGVSERANGKRPAQDPPWVIETKFEPNGLRGVRDLRERPCNQPYSSGGHGDGSYGEKLDRILTWFALA
jgi:hypothetical protein